MGEWNLFNDPSSNNSYYVHSVTGESQWEAPEDVRALWDFAGANGPGVASYGLAAKSTLSGWWVSS